MISNCSNSGSTAPRTTARVVNEQCRSTQLRLSFDKSFPPLSNQASAYFTFTNVGSESCQLEGYPTVELYLANGTAIQVRDKDGNNYEILDPGVRPVVLAPGGMAYFGIGWVVITLSGSPAGCMDATSARAKPPGLQKSLTTLAQLETVCPGLLKTTAVGSMSAFQYGPAKP
jgi:Protein of unknown function (DUF4232)